MASVDIILNAVDNTKAAMNSASSGLEKVKSAVGTATAAFGLATVAVGAVMAAVTKAANSFTDYSDQVKAVARTTGASAEESSKLIQVTDDLFISYESLTIAMRSAVKKGIEPNMESLAILSDTYLSLAPGLERSTFLLERFGKSGLEMGKMMEVGADGLRAMADAVPEGLILNDNDVAVADSLKIAFDNLGDTVTAFGLKLTTDAAPGILKFINGITTLVAKMDESYDIWGENAAQLKIYTDTAAANNAIKERAIKLWQEEGSAIGKSADAFETLLTPAQQANLLVAADMELNHNTAAGAMDAMGMGADAATEAIKKLSEEQDKGGPKIENVTEVLTEEEQKLLDVAEAAKAAAISTANLGMVGNIMSVQGAYDTLTSAADAFATKQAEVDALMATGPKTWQKMEGGWELSAVPQETLDSLGELKGKFDEARAASERWIKEFIFSMVQAKLSAGGLDDIEFTQLLQVGQGLGLIDPAVAATTQAVADAINSTDPAGIDQAVAGLSELFGYGGQPIVITPVVAPPVTASAYAQTTAAVTTTAPTTAPTTAAPIVATTSEAAVPQETVDSYSNLASSIDASRIANEKWVKQFVLAQAQIKLASKPEEISDAKLEIVSDISAKLGAIEPGVATTTQAVMDAISQVDVTGLDEALEDMRKLFSYDGKEIQVNVNAPVPPPPSSTPPPGELNIPTGYYSTESNIPASYYNTNERASITTEQAENGKGTTNNYYIDRATFMLERGAEGEILARLTE